MNLKSPKNQGSPLGQNMSFAACFYGNNDPIVVSTIPIDIYLCGLFPRLAQNQLEIHYFSLFTPKTMKIGMSVNGFTIFLP